MIAGPYLIANNDASNRNARAFTLVELVVVMGIVMLLVGIVLSVGSIVSERIRITQTETTMKILDTAVQEWQSLSSRELLWWQFGDTYELREFRDVHSDTPEVFIITEVLDVISRSSDIKQILAQIDDEFVYRYHEVIDGGEFPSWIDTPQEETALNSRFLKSNTYLDNWGIPIYVIHPGRLWKQSDGNYYSLPKDEDGTIRTYNEDKYGIASNRKIVFVSAGPDRKFGLSEEFSELNGVELAQAKIKAHRDNIFSKPVAFDDNR